MEKKRSWRYIPEILTEERITGEGFVYFRHFRRVMRFHTGTLGTPVPTVRYRYYR